MKRKYLNPKHSYEVLFEGPTHNVVRNRSLFGTEDALSVVSKAFDNRDTLKKTSSKARLDLVGRKETLPSLCEKRFENINLNPKISSKVRHQRSVDLIKQAERDLDYVIKPIYPYFYEPKDTLTK